MNKELNAMNRGNLALAALLGSQPLTQAERTAALNLVDPDGIFTLHLEGVYREGSGMPKRDDRITLDESVEKALVALQEAFCMEPQMPRTWGRLMGLVEGLGRVHLASLVDDATWRANAGAFAAQFPELLTPVQAYREGDRQLLSQYWSKVLTLEAMALHWDADTGWAGLPRLKEKRALAP